MFPAPRHHRFSGATGAFAFDGWWRDLRHGARALWRSPSFTLVSTLTLALGVGAVTVIYSVIYNGVIEPLPYRDADRLVNVMVQEQPDRPEPRRVLVR